MDWIYLSPHLDDAVYSCGGLIAEQTQAGDQVAIWTVCAGEPEPDRFSPLAEALHARWETGPQSVAARRREDRQAVARLLAVPRHLDLLDCIYRKHPEAGEFLYPTLEAVFGPLHPVEEGLVDWLAGWLREEVPAGAVVVCPLALGGHVDHRLTRAAVERAGIRPCFYADFPYAVRVGEDADVRIPKGWQMKGFPVSAASLERWQQAIGLYTSQFSTFWASEDALKAELQAYVEKMGGVPLWSPAIEAETVGQV